MMGGDGGLTHSLKQLSQLVDLGKVAFVTLPFGSGNDTSRVFGWGGMPDEPHLFQLSQICLDIAERSQMESLNIWEVKISFTEDSNVWKVAADSSD